MLIEFNLEDMHMKIKENMLVEEVSKYKDEDEKEDLVKGTTVISVISVDRHETMQEIVRSYYNL